MTRRRDPRVAARRLRVFRFVKAAMEVDGDCPPPIVVADALGISSGDAKNDMNALRNADGLPFPIPHFRLGTVRLRHYRDKEMEPVAPVDEFMFTGGAT